MRGKSLPVELLKNHHDEAKDLAFKCKELNDVEAFKECFEEMKVALHRYLEEEEKYGQIALAEGKYQDHEITENLGKILKYFLDEESNFRKYVFAIFPGFIDS